MTEKKLHFYQLGIVGLEWCLRSEDGKVVVYFETLEDAKAWALQHATEEERMDFYMDQVTWGKPADE